MINVLRYHRSDGAILRSANALLSQIDSDFPVAIVSWEGLLGLPFVSGRLYGGATPFLQMIAEVGRRSERLIRPILYVREQVEFLTSWYAQRVKEGSSQTVAEYIDEVPLDGLLWSAVIADVEAQLGPVRIESYERIKFCPSRYTDPILEEAGAPVDLLERTPAIRLNEAYNARSMRIAQFVNRHCKMTKEARSEFRKLLLAMIPHGEPLKIFSDSKAYRIAEKYAADNQKVFQNRR